MMSSTVRQSEDLHRRIDLITKGLKRTYFNKLLKEIADSENPLNASMICDYIIAEQNDINIKPSTLEDKIKKLAYLSKYHSNKSFLQMTRQDILLYLNTLRKSYSEDPSQRWVGTYNSRQMVYLKFFKWLYYPDKDARDRDIPPCMHGIKQLPKKTKSRYQANDLWTPDEHAVFLKYVPNIRNKCYHAMARDTSARPHELLNLKIKDIIWSMNDTGEQYAEIEIKDGKTGSRTVPLIDSVPYVKAWILAHPTGTNPESWLFVSINGHGFGQKLTPHSMWKNYVEVYQRQYFPSLLKREDIPDKDKEVIKKLLKKPFNPYVQRHTGITEKSKILSDGTLRVYAGWGPASKMLAVYKHLFGNEASKKLLEERGLLPKTEQDKSVILRTKTCPHCKESNIPDARFCQRCQMILTYDAYTSVKKKIDDMIRELVKEQLTQLGAQIFSSQNDSVSCCAG